MTANITPHKGELASLSRRDLFMLATAAGAISLPNWVNAKAEGKPIELARQLEEQLDDCVAQLRTILMQMHPEATEVGKVDPTRVSNPDGSFFFVMSGRIPPQPFQGDGYYMVSVDGYPQLFRLEHRHTYGRSTGKILPGQDYFLATAIHEDGYVDQLRRMASPRILRKMEGGLEL